MNQRVTPPVPSSMEDVAKYYRRLALLLRQIRQEEDSCNAEIEKLTSASENKIANWQQEAVALAKSVFAYAKKNRDELTDEDKKKTVDVVGTGTFSWYKTPPAVYVDKGLKVEELLANIKTLGLTQFIRSKEEPNKEAMLEDSETANTIKGVTIMDSEKFVIRPMGAELRVEHRIGSRSWKITEPDK